MGKVAKITDAEWQVMKILWEKAPMTSSQIVEILRMSMGWSPTTIYTLINRLVKKEAITIEKGSSPHVCKPLLSEKEYKRQERNLFLNKLYNGSLNLMLINILEEGEFSEDEIDELKRILDDSKNKGR